MHFGFLKSIAVGLGSWAFVAGQQVPSAWGQDQQEQSEVIEYRTVGPWLVRIDSTLGYRCFAVAEYGRDSALRFGATGDGTTFYFMVLNRLWRSLTVGSEHDISLVFDDYAPWSGAATAVDFGDGVKGLWIDVDSDFLTEFAKAEALYLSYEGDIIGSFDLEDSAKAMVVMLECEQNLDAILADVGLDPFAGGTRTDPFAGRVGERR